jgi:hypothetical protein
VRLYFERAGLKCHLLTLTKRRGVTQAVKPGANLPKRDFSGAAIPLQPVHLGRPRRAVTEARLGQGRSEVSSGRKSMREDGGN